MRNLARLRSLRRTAACLLCSVLCLHAVGQEDRLPYSFRHAVSPSFPTETLPPVDHALLLRATESDTDKSGGFTFGTALPADFSPLNAGQWENLPDGARLWRLGLRSEQAFSVNLLFDYFRLPEGGKLYLYTADSSFFLSYSAKDNLPGGTFATPLLPGSHIVMEYYEPAGANRQGALHLSSLVHGYKDFFFQNGTTGNSGFCNIDIRCQEGEAFQDVKRAVCMILNGTKILCSGTLINNTRQDKTPYVLTAYHCLNNAEAANLVFVFGREADSCGSLNFQEGYAISGATVVAKNYDSDFALLRLSQQPPAHYRVYYAGWNSNDTAADSAVCIHHPSGDVKKISVCTQTLEPCDNEGDKGSTHWKVPHWSKGTTERGSSGCGLFNPQKQLIGQLDGGTASCLYTEGYDVFGKVAYSWDNSQVESASRRLRDWLDPDSSGLTALDGLDADSSVYMCDAQLLAILSPQQGQCSRQLRPKIAWMNNGNQRISSLKIHYSIDSSEVKTIFRTGKWAYGETDTLTLDTLYALSEGAHRLRVWLALEGDKQHANDTLCRHFTYQRGTQVHWRVKTDYYPEQTQWELKDAQGNIIARQPEGLHFLTTYADTFCLAEGCYDFVIRDANGDGLTGREGYYQGFYYLYLQEQCIASGMDFGYKDSLRFCIDSATTLPKRPETAAQPLVTLYPNPCSDRLHLRIAPAWPGDCHIVLFAMDGRKLKSWEMRGNDIDLELSGLPSGMYLLQLQCGDRIFRKRFVRE
ncbi:MAG: trypsin-like peptidase domain-containing protein [Bacteroidales bacterium]|nr:trypsin-like peptidase domain-containing protein [Bacteroidales bacterium]